MSMPDGSPDYPEIAADIGLTALRVMYPALTGAGVTVGQVEGSDSGASGPTAIDYEVDPAEIGQPANNSNDFITYWNGLRHTFTYDDGIIGTYSHHATYMGSFFYDSAIYEGAPTGIAPGVAHVDNYNAANFLENLLAGYPDKVVNMSFLYDPSSNEDDVYDTAANLHNTVFVASAGNGGTPGSPSSAYNVISVDSSIMTQAIGPASDGVPKPDISAPQTATSRTAAIVSGCAALLVQAGTNGYPGATAQNEADAVDFRTVKALLLNGATKPADYYTTSYAPTASQPLNAVYGAGQVNIFNSVSELYGGEHGAGGSFDTPASASGFTQMAVSAIAAQLGWNLATATAPAGDNAIDRYGFDIAAGANFEATLTWASDDNNAIDTLGLYLYNATTGALVASSAAPLSNVQQIDFAGNGGSYDLDVELMGTSSGALSDTYALAFAQTPVACFCAGTLIGTEAGDVPVERLCIGDRVVTAAGAFRDIGWIGRRRIDCRRHPRPWQVWPVRVRAGAFGEAGPCRDLLLSPDHAVWVADGGGALIPVKMLINGTSIRQIPAGVVTYFHVSLPGHDVLLAEGLACESYLDTGGPERFEAGGRIIALHPDFSFLQRESQGCAPLAITGPIVEATRRRINARAALRAVRQQNG